MPKKTKEITIADNLLSPFKSDDVWFSEFEVDEIKKKLKEELDKIHINNRSRRNMIIKYINIIDSVFDALEEDKFSNLDNFNSHPPRVNNNEVTKK